MLISGDGHTWVALDYRETGPEGEPTVAWLDVVLGDDLTLAPTFDSFMSALRVFEIEP